VQALTEADPRQIADFTLVGRLGGGGMGMVYLGRRRADDAPAAVKVIRPDLLADDEVRTRFDREASAAMRVRSSRAAVLDAGFDAGRAYLACEYIEGPTLDSAIVKNGPLAESELVELATGLSEALIDIHGTGLVHRDLTPRNVLLTYAGPRVIDFGIAYVDDNPAVTSTGSIIGTPGYVAPERLRDQLSIPAGDVFAVGALLAYAATGHSPYGGGTPIGIHMRVAETRPTIDVAGVPASFERLIRDCLASDPADRPDAWALSERVTEIARKVPRVGAARVPKQRPAKRSGAADSGGSAVSDGGLISAEEPTAAAPILMTMADAAPPPAPSRVKWVVLGALVLATLIAVTVAAPWRTTSATPPGAKTSPDTSPSRTPPSSAHSSAPASTGPNSPSPTPKGSPTTQAPPAGSLAPGVRDVNQQFFDNSILQLTLTTVEVKADGTVTATVRYHNTSIIPVPLVCEAVTDPGTDTITLSDGTRFAAAHTYCSDNPGATVTLNPDDVFDSYATFAQVVGPAGPGELDWQTGNAISGKVTGIAF
jgi:serine/threonine protein kinase